MSRRRKIIELSTEIEELFLKLGFKKINEYGRPYYADTVGGFICRPISNNKLKAYKDCASSRKYGVVSLEHKDGTYKTHYTHRLIGQFKDHAPEKTVLHHTTFNRANNSLDSLEWLSYKDHLAIHRQHQKKKRGD